LNLQRYIESSFLGKKILRPILGFLKAGVSPGQLAVAFSLGVVVGIIPLLGSTTLICAILAFSLRLNMPVLQLANYCVFPLQLLLFIPFFQIGGYLFEPLEIPASVTEISEMLQADFLGAIQQFWFANLQALLAWLLLAIPLYLLLYFILLLLFKRMALAFSKNGSSRT
jgi:uncharacterized protein (DUF2062 family)